MATQDNPEEDGSDDVVFIGFNTDVLFTGFRLHGLSEDGMKTLEEEGLVFMGFDQGKHEPFGQRKVASLPRRRAHPSLNIADAAVEPLPTPALTASSETEERLSAGTCAPIIYDVRCNSPWVSSSGLSRPTSQLDRLVRQEGRPV